MKIDKITNFGTHVTVKYNNGSERIIRPRNPRYIRVCVNDIYDSEGHRRTTEMMATHLTRTHRELVVTRVDGSDTTITLSEHAIVNVYLHAERSDA